MIVVLIREGIWRETHGEGKGCEDRVKDGHLGAERG